MAAELPLLDVRNRQAWRRWLDQHHASSAGVWLVFHKAHTAEESIDYDDSVREALCFGWIDSLIKRIDDDRYARKFTPRKPTSTWSDSNRKRWAELNVHGLLAAAGLAARPTSSRSSNRPQVPELPAYIARGLKASPGAWRFFRSLPPSHRRDYVMWIHMAKRPDTRQRRIQQSIALLAAGRKLGLK